MTKTQFYNIIMEWQTGQYHLFKNDRNIDSFNSFVPLNIFISTLDKQILIQV